ncbi:MAG: hypothetical protein KIT09_14495 [Bryobacteraceae bacterium]|nr:hypothetical protein [Bryobacteraceae bacterium]
MRRASTLAGLLAACLACAADPADLGNIRAVYLLPMSNGLDQYLANQLTRHGVFEVVTDPLRADALFTDEIGQRFERQVQELYPPPPKPPQPKEDEGEAAPAKDARSGQFGDIVGDVEPVPLSTFGRGKGNLFLVGRESRRVLWSTYHRPKNASTRELNSAAEKIVGQLKDKLPAR